MKVGQTVLKFKFYRRRGKDKPSSNSSKNYLDLAKLTFNECMRKFWSATFHKNYFHHWTIVMQLHLYRTLTKSLAKSNKTDKHFVLLLIQMGASVCAAYYTTVNESAKMFSDSWAAFPMPNCGPFIAKNGANPSFIHSCIF